MRRSLSIAAAVACFAACGALPASANLLAPAGTVVPDAFGAIAGPVLATITKTVPSALPNDFTGTYTEQVVADAGRGGLLDFIIQVTNVVGAGLHNSIERITLSSFGSVVTDVGIAPSAGTLAGGTVAATTVNRDGSGNVIGFNVTLPQGSMTEVLVIETDSRVFFPGNVSMINAGVATDGGFAPVPGPLVGAGLPGLVAACGALLALARRRRNASAPV
jgi:hypothetical protein